MARNQNANDQAFQERVQRFAAWFTRAIIAYQQREGVWVTSGKEVASLINVAPSTVLAWTKGKSLPQREQCVKIAERLHIPMAEIFTAAGYSLKEGIPVTYEELLQRIQEHEIFDDPKEEQYVAERISLLLGEKFRSSAYMPVADLLLGHVATSLAVRAHQLAALAEAWKAECNRPYSHVLSA